MNTNRSSNANPNPITKLLVLPPYVGQLSMLAIALVLTLLLGFGFNSTLTTVQERLGALGWTLSPDQSLEQRIIIVDIDERSMAEIGAWPWPREVLADLTRIIDEAGAQLQIHDIAYPESTPADAEFAAALEQARGVVLAHNLVIQSEQTVQAGLLTHSLQGINCAAGVTGVGDVAFPATQNYISANGAFSNVAKGHITPIISNDGAVTKTPAAICIDGEAYPALSLAALLQAAGGSNLSVSLERGASVLAPAQTMTLDVYPGLEIPLDQDGNIRISYSRHPSSYLAVSAFDVFNGDFDASMFDNAWVLIGGTAFSMGDIVPTPYAGDTAGVELQARLLGSLLDVSVPYTPRAAVWLQALLALLASAALLGLANREGRWSVLGLPIAAIALPAFVLLTHIWLLSAQQLWLGWIYPALYAAIAASGLLLLEQARVRAERSRVLGNLSSYLPGDVAKEIAYTLPSSAINARHADVTLLSADLRNFSAFGESRPAEEAAAVLHFFFTQATAIVEQHGGRVHEFKGDSLLAVWDSSNKQSAELALATAKAMQAALDHDLLPDYAPDGLEPLALGIGIEQGPALIGSIGPAHRRTHTLLGDTVTIALRIQELTADLAQPILLGSCVARQLDHQSLSSQGSYLLSGLKIPHTLFAPAADTNTDRADPSRPSLTVVAGGRR